jgi:phosphatidate cytidylyltransferase
VSPSPQSPREPNREPDNISPTSRPARAKRIRDSQSLRLRLISVIILIPLVVAVIYAGGWWFLAAMTLVFVLASREFVTLMRSGGYRPSWLFCLTIILLLILEAALPSWRLGLRTLSVFIMASLIWQLFDQKAGSIVDWALAIAFGLYLGIVASNSVLLRNGPGGRLWMAYVVLISWAIDGAAYTTGRAWGRHKLWPQVSPGKTWEGAIGGWLVGVGVSLMLCWLIGVGWQHGLALGVWVATISPFGDLAISMLKRQVGAKDSGNLIPGHGGMLDRLDSILFTVLLVRLYVTVFITN